MPWYSQAKIQVEHSTGILLFSRLPAYEAQVKTLAACKEKNARIWRQLYNNTLNAARNTNLPLLICHNELQEGNTFSERITSAVEKAFEGGLEHLIVIGSDCPGMNSAEITKAANYLQQNKQIIAGADHRGGVYILGIARSAFDKECFKNFRWQTNQLFKDLVRYAANFNFALSENKLNDVHCFDDILQALNSSYFSTNLRQLIFRLLHMPENVAMQEYAFFKSSLPVNQFSLRAPPCFY